MKTFRYFDDVITEEQQADLDRMFEIYCNMTEEMLPPGMKLEDFNPYA